MIENSVRVMTPTNWMNERFNAYREKYALCDAAENIPYDPDPDFTALTQADIYTYRTPDYGLSCSQNFRKGKQGYQQMIWGANLGGRAVVYTNHPGSRILKIDQIKVQEVGFYPELPSTKMFFSVFTEFLQTIYVCWKHMPISRNTNLMR